jgi:hypothetical protein
LVKSLKHLNTPRDIRRGVRKKGALTTTDARRVLGLWFGGSGLEVLEPQKPEALPDKQAHGSGFL